VFVALWGHGSYPVPADTDPTDLTVIKQYATSPKYGFSRYALACTAISGVLTFIVLRGVYGFTVDECAGGGVHWDPLFGMKQSVLNGPE